MSIRVAFINEAIEDLVGYSQSNIFPHLLAKLIRLEEMGKDAGLPLGRGLTGWRKIVVGDRQWRIIYTMSADDSTATVWVIGDRDDAACYTEALKRVSALDKQDVQAQSLAAVLVGIIQAKKQTKQ